MCNAPVYPIHKPEFFVASKMLESGDGTLADDERVSRRNWKPVMNDNEHLVFGQSAFTLDGAEYGNIAVPRATC